MKPVVKRIFDDIGVITLGTSYLRWTLNVMSTDSTKPSSFPTCNALHVKIPESVLEAFTIFNPFASGMYLVVNEPVKQHPKNSCCFETQTHSSV